MEKLHSTSIFGIDFVILMYFASIQLYSSDIDYGLLTRNTLTISFILSCAGYTNSSTQRRDPRCYAKHRKTVKYIICEPIKHRPVKYVHAESLICSNRCFVNIFLVRLFQAVQNF